MESTRPIRALVRGLDALTVLNSRNGATVSEVAQEVRLPRTTVYRILETLCEAGFAFRDAADERYRVDMRVRGLSDGFADETWVPAVAKPCIEELCREISWPISLATLLGTELMLRATTDHSTPLATPRYSAGSRVPLMTTAAGHVYLAFCQTSERDSLLHELGATQAQRTELQPVFAEIRALGYATATRSRRLTDEVSVSVPVMVRDEISAVVSVRFTSTAALLESTLERFLPNLRHCAARIGGLLLDEQAPDRARPESVPSTAVS